MQTRNEMGSWKNPVMSCHTRLTPMCQSFLFIALYEPLSQATLPSLPFFSLFRQSISARHIKYVSYHIISNYSSQTKRFGVHALFRHYFSVFVMSLCLIRWWSEVYNVWYLMIKVEMELWMETPKIYPYTRFENFGDFLTSKICHPSRWWLIT